MLFLISTSCRELVCILGWRSSSAGSHGAERCAIAKSTRDGLWCNNGKSLKLLLMNQVGDDMAMLQGRIRIVVVDYHRTKCHG